LFFWSERTGWESQNEQQGMEEELLITKIEDANGGKKMPEFQSPHMMSAVSNWKPKKM